jgi:hypothetical protein
MIVTYLTSCNDTCVELTGAQTIETHASTSRSGSWDSNVKLSSKDYDNNNSTYSSSFNESSERLAEEGGTTVFQWSLCGTNHTTKRTEHKTGKNHLSQTKSRIALSTESSEKSWYSQKTMANVATSVSPYTIYHPDYWTFDPSKNNWVRDEFFRDKTTASTREGKYENGTKIDTDFTDTSGVHGEYQQSQYVTSRTETNCCGNLSSDSVGWTLSKTGSTRATNGVNRQEVWYSNTTKTCSSFVSASSHYDTDERNSQKWDTWCEPYDSSNFSRSSRDTVSFSNTATTSVRFVTNYVKHDQDSCRTTALDIVGLLGFQTIEETRVGSDGKAETYEGSYTAIKDEEFPYTGVDRSYGSNWSAEYFDDDDMKATALSEYMCTVHKVIQPPARNGSKKLVYAVLTKTLFDKSTSYSWVGSNDLPDIFSTFDDSYNMSPPEVEVVDVVSKTYNTQSFYKEGTSTVPQERKGIATDCEEKYSGTGYFMGTGSGEAGHTSTCSYIWLNTDSTIETTTDYNHRWDWEEKLDTGEATFDTHSVTFPTSTILETKNPWLFSLTHAKNLEGGGKDRDLEWGYVFATNGLVNYNVTTFSSTNEHAGTTRWSTGPEDSDYIEEIAEDVTTTFLRHYVSHPEGTAYAIPFWEQVVPTTTEFEVKQNVYETSNQWSKEIKYPLGELQSKVDDDSSLQLSNKYLIRTKSLTTNADNLKSWAWHLYDWWNEGGGNSAFSAQTAAQYANYNNADPSHAIPFADKYDTAYTLWTAHTERSKILYEVYSTINISYKNSITIPYSVGSLSQCYQTAVTTSALRSIKADKVTEMSFSSTSRLIKNSPKHRLTIGHVNTYAVAYVDDDGKAGEYWKVNLDLENRNTKCFTLNARPNGDAGVSPIGYENELLDWGYASFTLASRAEATMTSEQKYTIKHQAYKTYRAGSYFMPNVMIGYHHKNKIGVQCDDDAHAVNEETYWTGARYNRDVYKSAYYLGAFMTDYSHYRNYGFYMPTMLVEEIQPATSGNLTREGSVTSEGTITRYRTLTRTRILELSDEVGMMPESDFIDYAGAEANTTAGTDYSDVIYRDECGNSRYLTLDPVTTVFGGNLDSLKYPFGGIYSTSSVWSSGMIMDSSSSESRDPTCGPYTAGSRETYDDPLQTYPETFQDEHTIVSLKYGRQESLNPMLAYYGAVLSPINAHYTLTDLVPFRDYYPNNTEAAFYQSIGNQNLEMHGARKTTWVGFINTLKTHGTQMSNTYKNDFQLDRAITANPEYPVSDRSDLLGYMDLKSHLGVQADFYFSDKYRVQPVLLRNTKVFYSGAWGSTSAAKEGWFKSTTTDDCVTDALDAGEYFSYKGEFVSKLAERTTYTLTSSTKGGNGANRSDWYYISKTQNVVTTYAGHDGIVRAQVDEASTDTMAFDWDRNLAGTGDETQVYGMRPVPQDLPIIDNAYVNVNALIMEDTGGAGRYGVYLGNDLSSYQLGVDHDWNEMNWFDSASTHAFPSPECCHCPPYPFRAKGRTWKDMWQNYINCTDGTYWIWNNALIGIGEKSFDIPVTIYATDHQNSQHSSASVISQVNNHLVAELSEVSAGHAISMKTPNVMIFQPFEKAYVDEEFTVAPFIVRVDGAEKYTYDLNNNYKTPSQGGFVLNPQDIGSPKLLDSLPVLPPASPWNIPWTPPHETVQKELNYWKEYFRKIMDANNPFESPE